MEFICPIPMVWNEIYRNLLEARQERFSQGTHIPPPPVPLILGSWNYSSDAEKKIRWQITVQWAERYKFDHLIPELQPDQIYSVEDISTNNIGPLGGPMFLPWDTEPKYKPSKIEVDSALNLLRSEWEIIVGSELSRATWPIKFTGKKYRRLLLLADKNFQPTWGTWKALACGEKRRSFTHFRKAINESIKPLVVDHIDFIPVDDFNQRKLV